MRLLVVDDDPIFARTLGRLLVRMGVAPTLATGAAAAITWLDTAAFDVVLCDGDLGSGASGLDVLERARSRVPDAARVLMSADAGRWAARDAARGLVDHLLAKPFGLDDLARVLTRSAPAVLTPSRAPGRRLPPSA
jgi:ActR/RegA family two-component response regulator